MNKLTIFWGDKKGDSFIWYSDAAGDTASAIPQLESKEILKADLACIADMAAGHKVELIISSTDVHMANVNVPGRAQRHLRKAVPYMLEEQVAESVDDLFIAISSRKNEDLIPVRAITYQYLEEIVELFKSAEIKLTSVVVDLDCLDYDQEGLLALIGGETVFVAGSQGNNWQCDREDFSWLIQKQLNSQEENDEMPIAIPLKIVTDNEDTAKLFEQDLPAGRFAPSIDLVEDINEFVAKGSDKAINLLQAEFEPKAESSAIKKLITKVAIVAGLVLSVHLTYQGSQWFALSAKVDVLESQKEAMWKQAFPGRKMPKSANRQIRSALKSIGAGGGDSTFLTMLDDVSGKIGNFDELYPTNISFDVSRNELRLDLIGKEYATLNQYRDVLVNAGYQVDMNSATQRGDAYSSRFIVKK